jgi:hypothetical protein
MPSKPKQPLDQVLDRLREHLPVKPSPLPGSSKTDKDDSSGIVSRRDERGTPYPGDFPNPASDRTRGCF